MVCACIHVDAPAHGPNVVHAYMCVRMHTCLGAGVWICTCICTRSCPFSQGQTTRLAPNHPFTSPHLSLLSLSLDPPVTLSLSLLILASAVTLSLSLLIFLSLFLSLDPSIIFFWTPTIRGSFGFSYTTAIWTSLFSVLSKPTRIWRAKSRCVAGLTRACGFCVAGVCSLCAGMCCVQACCVHQGHVLCAVCGRVLCVRGMRYVRAWRAMW